MCRTSSLLALAATFSSTLAAFQGFNYGSTFTSGAAKAQADFEAEFKTAQGLVGAPGGGFTSARLYTTVQAGTANSPISAIPAAISTKTSLLLGLWASAGDAVFANELVALKAAIAQYGTAFTSLVAGISVGSEDLYRISPTGILNKENPGAAPLTLAGYIKQVRDLIAGTALASAPIGHVDTWTAWVNGSNQAVIDACDWIGVDAYPYFQSTQSNDIAYNKGLFNDALGATQAAVGGKPVWVTETGFPVSGKTVGQAVPSKENAKTYWDQVGCPMFGKTNVWWYTMQDAAPDTPNPSFGLIGNALTTTPLFDISCKNVDTSSTPVQSSASGSKASSAPTASVVDAGSPGADSAVPSSQLSIQTQTTVRPTGTGTGVQPTGTSASNTSVGSGAGGSNGTISTTARPSASATTSPNSGALVRGSLLGAVGAFVAAVAAL